MTLLELRALVFDEIGVRHEQDVYPDSALVQSWNHAVDFWLRYRKPVSKVKHIGFTVDDSLTHEFEGRIPETITGLYQLPKGSKVPCWLYWYSKPSIFLKDPLPAGDYSVTFVGSMNYEEMLPREVPDLLLRLICAYTKRKIGQFLKLGDYAAAPFTDDGEAWYREGTAQAKEIEDFIIVNKDERSETITDFSIRPMIWSEN